VVGLQEEHEAKGLSLLPDFLLKWLQDMRLWFYLSLFMTDVTILGDDCTQPYITKEEYEKYLSTQQPSNANDDINNTYVSDHQEVTDSIMVEVQPRYNLRSRNKSTLISQPRKILPRGEVYVPTPKETETSKGTDLLDPKTKEVETQTREIKMVDTQTPVIKITSNKSAHTNKLEKKELEVLTRETDKGGGGFSVENEINRIKIHIMLVELAKNPTYRKHIVRIFRHLGVS
jgi:hypothetical protein